MTTQPSLSAAVSSAAADSSPAVAAPSLPVAAGTPNAAESDGDELCRICGRPGRLAVHGPGHAVLFARVAPFDFHRYAPSRHMQRLWALRKEMGS